jgi:hypothetical protein
MEHKKLYLQILELFQVEVLEDLIEQWESKYVHGMPNTAFNNFHI